MAFEEARFADNELTALYVPKNAHEFTYWEEMPGSQDGLWKLFTPDDESRNIANHYKVHRSFLGSVYEHHFITAYSWEQGNKFKLQIIHYSNCVKEGAKAIFHPVRAIALGSPSLAEIRYQEISVSKKVGRDGSEYLEFVKGDDVDDFDLIQVCLEGKLSRGFNNCYASTEPDRIAAVNRALVRVGEAAYNITEYNCEHFVNEVLLGEAKSIQGDQQIWKGTFVDILARLPNLSFRSVMRHVFNCFLHIPKLIKQADSPAKLVKLIAGEFDGCWEKYIGMAVKTGSKAITAGEAAIRAGISGGLSAGIEAIYLIAQTCYDLYCLCKAGTLKAEQLVNNFFDRFSGSLGSIAGTMVGGFLGLFIPLPFGIGIMIGSLIGGGLGRLLGSAIGKTAGRQTAVGQNLKIKMIEAVKKHEKSIS